MARFQIVGEICCATTIFDCPSLLVAVVKAEYTVVVLDSRYYSFTQQPILENHFAFFTIVVKFCETWSKKAGDNGKKKGKRFQFTS